MLRFSQCNVPSHSPAPSPHSVPQTDAQAPRSVLPYARALLAAEGPSFAVRGIGANMVAIGLSSGIRVGLYPVARDLLSGGSGRKHPLAMTLASMGCGMFGYWCSAPLYQAKVILQVAPPVPYGNMVAAVRGLFRQGVRHAYRGSVVLAVRGGLFTCGQMLGYDLFKTHAKRLGVEDGPPLHFAASVVAACSAVTLHMPADVVFARYQSLDRGKASPVTAALDLVRRQGPAALLRGWTVALARILPAMVVAVPLMEQVRRLFGLDYFD